MAVLRSKDGTFYEVPDEDLEQYRVPPQKVKELLRSLENESLPAADADQEPDEVYSDRAAGASVVAGAGGTVIINVYTGGGPVPSFGGDTVELEPPC